MPRVSLAPPSLRRLLPALPATVRDLDVPPLFRQRFVSSGYRQTGLPWRCYALGLFQMHNETLSAWSHLLAAAVVLLRFAAFAVLQGGGILGVRLQDPNEAGLSVDAASLPLVLYAFSAVLYLGCSAAARLLQSHSEEARYSLFFLESAGLAVYRYGGALALCLYSANTAWMQSMLGQVFLLVAGLLCCSSCASCCFATLRLRRPDRLHGTLCQLVPMGAAYLLVISPLTDRLATYRWSNSPAMLLHILQAVLFLLSAFFFSCPVPERFSPGSFDLVGHSRQLFHVLLSLCALAQQEALFQDFLWRRPALVRQLGEERLLLACASFPCVALCCALTALAMRRRAQVLLREEQGK